MKRYVVDGREFWIGTHRKLGVVIYDPLSQVDVPYGKVRLFIASEQRMALFVRDIVRECIVRSGRATNQKHSTRSPDEYEHEVSSFSRKRVRVTHCFNCKSDLNSVDFSICPGCDWIKCPCGGCGCNYGRF